MHKVLGRLGFRSRHKHQRQLAGLGGIILGGSITTSSGASKVTGHASAPDQNRASPAGSAASTTRWTRRVDIGPTVATPNDSDKRQRSTGSPATPSRGSGRCKRARRGVLDQDSAVVAEHGLAPVTMSQIAEQTGIGRATLYKYFSDVEAILVAWHERQITGHLEQLAQVRNRARDPSQRLQVVLETYGLIVHEHHRSELAALLHQGAHVARAQRHLTDFVRERLAKAAATGDFRDDVEPGELANYCLRALTAASSLSSKAAVRRLVIVILDGLKPRA